MPPEDFKPLDLAYAYMVIGDERVLLGKIAPLEIHINCTSEDDKIIHTLKQSYEGTFKIKTISKGILRHCKYLKRVKNRKKLYKNRKAKYGK